MVQNKTMQRRPPIPCRQIQRNDIWDQVQRRPFRHRSDDTDNVFIGLLSNHVTYVPDRGLDLRREKGHAKLACGSYGNR